MVTRYHPWLVALHWLTGLMIIGLLTAGLVILHNTPNSDPHKVQSLAAHMGGGTLLLILMIVRMVLRVRTAKPSSKHFDADWMNKLGVGTHHLLYTLVFLLILSGMALSIAAGLPAIVYGGQGELPATFDSFGAKKAHALLARLLLIFAVLHVGAALYHQFVKRDGIFHRMWWGKP